MKICVAIPVYDGKIPVRTMNCLFNEQAIAIGAGDHLMINCLSSSAGIAQARNQLATEFMQSEFDRLVFVDSDITWNQGDLLNLAHRDVDFVGGAYRYKRKGEEYPIAWLPDPDKKGIPQTKDGLLGVQGIPTGFLALSRKVFQTFLEKHPERDLTIQNGHKCHAFFQMPFVDGHLYGEDLYFCREWSESGGIIYLDPKVSLTHWDFNPTPYPGNVEVFLNPGMMDKKIPAILSMEDALFQLKETTEKFKNIKENSDELPAISLS
jgi:hypothetical protein